MPMPEPDRPADHRPLLFDLAYRLTGDAEAADDIVQDALTRALTRPPADTSRPWRPWLVRVTANLARDHLRARRRRAYLGPWLPTPLPVDPEGPEGRLAQREAVGWATLVAHEALTPQQRTVLVLRDVLGLRATEVAELLGTGADAVRAAHRRARRALRNVPEEPPNLEAAVLEASARMGQALAEGDLHGLIAVLAPDVELRSDGDDGRYAAATRPVLGAEAVARFLIGIAKKGGPAEVTVVRRNDRPAFRIVRREAPPSYAPVSEVLLVLAPDGRVAQVHIVLGPSAV